MDTLIALLSLIILLVLCTGYVCFELIDKHTDILQGHIRELRHRVDVLERIQIVSLPSSPKSEKQD